MKNRRWASGALGLATLLLPASALWACMELPDREAIVLVPVDGEMALVDVRLYGSGAEAACVAHLNVQGSELPSLSRRPQPLQLAEHLAPVVTDWGATSCSIFVYLEVGPEVEMSWEDVCWKGDYRYDAIGWSTERADHRCFEQDV